jgi:hypothetical protein
VWVVQVVYSRVDRAHLLQQLREHLQRNIVRFGKTWHYQCHGIPQARLFIPTQLSLSPAHLQVCSTLVEFGDWICMGTLRHYPQL